MTIHIPSYQITESIYQGTRTEVYRAIRESDRTPVILKKLRNEYPTFNELVQFRHQYILTKNLDVPGVVQPLALEKYGNGYVMVMPDTGGISLSDYIQKHSLNLEEFLQIAIALCDILEHLYQHRTIHKDIKPANILINPDTQDIKLIDFSIASLLPKETQTLQNPNVLEGTLAYIAPEQTGRMNRGVDYRSDFYSLGVTFYELLTGELPFNSDDPMELVHCHIAKMPILAFSGQLSANSHNSTSSVRRQSTVNSQQSTVNNQSPTINQQIPPVLSEIVLKLMAKNAEDRYQSALGIRYDLEQCLEQWRSNQSIKSFKLAQRDICDRFSIPEKLYGREKEVQILLDAFERVANPPQTTLDRGGGRAEMMLVAGFSGIGKTAVVNEVHKPIVRQRGYFIKGKFDQFNRNIPFSAFVQAFRDLMGQLLGESDSKLRVWQQKILDALGENGQVIIEVIPELESIIGKQPAVPELSGSAATNRFNLLFKKFIQLFATQEHPLVIFIDDLQWVDSASLTLLKLLIGESDSGYLLLLGAYRNNEVSPTHPLMLTLEDIQKSGSTPRTITLTNLAQSHLLQLVADTLLCSLNAALPLVELVYQKTQGNPFFATQFLKGLYEDGWIIFQRKIQCWQCDIVQVRQLAITDDVVEFMANRLHKLSPETQAVLKLAACIGNQFDLETLAVVCERSPVEVATELWPALKEGLVFPMSENYKFFQGTEYTEKVQLSDISVEYKFLHDRVQQGAYSLIPESKKTETHLKIGKLLIQKIPDNELDYHLFTIVNQLNIGQQLIDDINERIALARLNLAAGKKAKAATAYQAATQYLNMGLQLLDSDPWQSQYELTLCLYQVLIESELLNTNYAQVESLIATSLPHLQSPLDAVPIYKSHIKLKIAQNNCQTAFDIGLNCLERLDIKLVDTYPDNLDIEKLYARPKISDRQQIAALEILSLMWAPAYIANPEIVPKIILTMVDISIEFGNSALAAFAYSLYGMLLCASETDFETGYQLGKLALRLIDRYSESELTCKVNQLFYGFIRNWKEPSRANLEPFQNNIQTGLDIGDFEFAGYSAVNYCDNLCLIGEPLEDIYSKQCSYIQLMKSLKQEFPFYTLKIWAQFTLNLIGQAEDPKHLIGTQFDSTKILPILLEKKAFPSVFFFYTTAATLNYLFGDYEATIEHIQQGEPYKAASAGLLPITQNPLYYSLALLAIYADRSDRQSEILTKVSENQAQLQRWADNAPENYLHKFDLVAAELNRVLNKKSEAIESYDRAIAGAKENGFVNEEALGNELAAKFYLNWGKEKVAADYMQSAYYAYSRWGAGAKVADLETRYPQLLAPTLNRETSPINLSATITHVTTGTGTSNSTSFSGLLDLSSAIKASQALSSQMELSELLSSLMRVVLQNAGGTKAALLLPKEGKLEIEAIASLSQKESPPKNLKIASLGESLPLEYSPELPTKPINYVWRTTTTVMVNDGSIDNKFVRDEYLMRYQPKSWLCAPLISQGNLTGILYLENHLTAGAFTGDRLELLKVLSSQAAISIENARLYEQAQNYAQQLEQSLAELKAAQLQLVQGEKMASLGQLVAGVAHEINNPVGFISGNLEHAKEYTEELLNHLRLYQEYYPHPVPEILESAEDIDLEYLIEDLPDLLASMQEGTDRIREISKSMRTFSRADTAKKVPFNLHEGIDSTLLILKHRLKANHKRPEIQIIKDYGDLPLVKCYPGQLNQVFMNLIANGIDALEEFNQGRSREEIKANPNQMTIQTAISEDGSHVQIKIQDNGSGMTPEVKAKIFDHLYTTKAVGKGTGLGLSISRQIVVEKHGGSMTCDSEPGKGTEFTIALPI